MKKIILVLSFLALQSFALECTPEQYSPYFTDKNETRYMYIGSAADVGGDIVIDKKSIKYDRKNHILSAWVISQHKIEKEFDIIKMFYRFNLKNGTRNIKEYVFLKCSGKVYIMGKFNEWRQVAPGSIDEGVLRTLKKYLKIK